MRPAPNRGLPVSILLAVVLLTIQTFVESAIATEPIRAEYAVRWNIQDGGPQSTQQVLAILGQNFNGSEQYKVEYFTLPRALSPPDDFSLILRRLVHSSGASQLTLKYRSDHPLATWTCLLPKPYRTKTEVDVSFIDAGSVNRAYSYSCTGDLTEPPAELHAHPKECSSTMTRTDGGGLAVEEWHLPGDINLIDVAREGPNTKEALAEFGHRVVEKLIQSGISPITRSKTELGSECSRPSS